MKNSRILNLKNFLNYLKNLYSEKVHEKLSVTVNSWMKAAFSNSASKELMKKYLKPENCELVRAPLLNPEVDNSDSRPEDFKSNDKLIYKNQKLLTKCMIPIIQIMNKCLERSDTGDIFDLACDAFQLLAYTHKDSSHIRRLSLKPAVLIPYKKLCTPSDSVSEYLFGNDLHKQIKDINESRKMTSNISTKRNFSNYAGSHKKARFDNRQKSFSEKRARQPFKKGKGQGSGRKKLTTVKNYSPASEDNVINILKFSLNNTPNNFVSRKISRNFSGWLNITSDIWILNITLGKKVELSKNQAARP